MATYTWRTCRALIQVNRPVSRGPTKLTGAVSESPFRHLQVRAIIALIDAKKIPAPAPVIALSIKKTTTDSPIACDRRLQIMTIIPTVLANFPKQNLDSSGTETRHLIPLANNSMDIS
jgi:hypothetical protein